MTPKQPKRRSVRKALAKSAKAKAKRATAPAASKLDKMVRALRQSKGATITDLMTLTGWQMHSVRGAIAGTLKKKRGLTITSSKTDGERVYRIGGRP